MTTYQQKHIVRLTKRERETLRDITKKGTHKARVITRARVLLLSAGGATDALVAEKAATNLRTVERIRRRYGEGGLERALYDAPRPGQPPILHGKVEATLVAIACSDPPKGRERWTLGLLQEQLLKRTKLRHISTVAIWHHLRNRGIKPWLEKNVVRAGSDPGVPAAHGGSPRALREAL